MTIRKPQSAAVLSIALLLSACESAPKSTPASPPAPTGDTTTATAKPAPARKTAVKTAVKKTGKAADKTAGKVAAIDNLQLSDVTVLGLRRLGLLNQALIAKWFNEIPSEDELFLDFVLSELDGASTASKSMDDLKLSEVTVLALATMEITVPSEIRSLDRKNLDELDVVNDLCRNEVAIAMQKQGWTVLRAEITNRPGATELRLNGELVGPIERNDESNWRRFLVRVPGDASDTSAFATLTVDIPSPLDGSPPVRWYKDIEVTRGNELRVAIDVAKAPIPSIGFAAKTPLSPAAVYAGDAVQLTCEGGTADTVWFTFASAAELAVDNYRTTPSAGSSTAGLPGWFRLRSTASQSADPRASLLDAPSMRPIILGRGASFTWNPAIETPAARIGVLVRDASGFWGFAERSIAVVDLRPGVWVMPNLPVDPSTLDAAARAIESVEISPINIYDTHAILDDLLYIARVGEPASFDLRMDEYRDASLPLATVTIDFGDGSAPVSVDAASAGRAQIAHTYAQGGTYRVTVRTTDMMGFEREHGTNVIASAETPDAAVATASVASTPSVRLRVATKTAESSFDLFRRAADQFARNVAVRTQPVCAGQKVGLAHIHDTIDRNLVDMMDGALVSALLQRDIAVYEREPLFQFAIDARGTVDGSLTVVPDQGSKLNERVRSTRAEATGSSPMTVTMTTENVVERSNPIAAPDVDVVIEYKLKRAEVTVVPAGAMLLRTAKIFAWVRVHERESMRILFDDAIEISLGGTIAASESSTAGSAWDSYPNGFMIRGRLKDEAIESVELSVDAPIAPTEPIAPMEQNLPQQIAPVVSPPPVILDPSVGGLLRGILGG